MKEFIKLLEGCIRKSYPIATFWEWKIRSPREYLAVGPQARPWRGLKGILKDSRVTAGQFRDPFHRWEFPPRSDESEDQHESNDNLILSNSRII